MNNKKIKFECIVFDLHNVLYYIILNRFNFNLFLKVDIIHLEFDHKSIVDQLVAPLRLSIDDEFFVSFAQPLEQNLHLKYPIFMK